MPASHVPVLLDETLALLSPDEGDVAVDCTAGRGGHASRIAPFLGKSGRLVLIDRDASNVAFAAGQCEELGPAIEAVHDTFVRAPAILSERSLRANLMLADLGFASNQMDDPARGFSMREDGPLDMRLDPSAGPTAADLLASMTEVELAKTIFEFGEDPFARKIARKLVEERTRRPITSTAELAGLVTDAYGRRADSSRMHPATRTFMALRIAVNDELGALRSLLDAINRGAEATHTGGWLEAGSRIAIIAFHSLEDRLVKRAFAELERRGLAERLTRKPRMASEQEVQANARSRSARLRAIRLSRG